MGRRFAAQMSAPLTAQPIEIEALKIGNNRENRGIERQRSARPCRHRTLRRLPGVGSRTGHAVYAIMSNLIAIGLPFPGPNRGQGRPELVTKRDQILAAERQTRRIGRH